MFDNRQLEVFRTVMEHKSVTVAAQVLGVTQPAISAQLSKFEAALGYPLFIRENRQLTPTPEAHTLLGEVAAVLDRQLQLVRTAHEIHETRIGSLSIASHPGPSISWLPPLISKFLAQRPGVTLKLISRQSQGIRDLIPARSFDLAIAELPVEHPMIAVKKFRVSFVIALPRTHLLADHPVLNPQMLSGYPFVSMFKGHMAQLGVARAFDEVGAHLNIVAECDYFASAYALAANGVGVALLDSISADSLKSNTNNIIIRRFEPTLHYDFAIFHPVDRPLSKLAKSFVISFESHIAPYLLLK
jgi:DNA-binding transcriptional LysR family regulator